MFTYPYPRPMVTVDAVVFTIRDGHLEVLLIKRGHEPFMGMWALPGGFVEMDEDLETAAARELAEETGVTGVRLEQFQTFGAVHRDPRGRLLTVAYVGLVDWRSVAPCGQDDAADAAWMPVVDLPQLATDHNTIIARALNWLDTIQKARPGNLDLLPPAIPTDQLRRALDACLR